MTRQGLVIYCVCLSLCKVLGCVCVFMQSPYVLCMLGKLGSACYIACSMLGRISACCMYVGGDRVGSGYIVCLPLMQR